MGYCRFEGWPRRGIGVSNTELRATFILRLWRDREAPAGVWRGEVVHGQSGCQARFASQADLLAYIAGQLAQAEREPVVGGDAVDPPHGR